MLELFFSFSPLSNKFLKIQLTLRFMGGWFRIWPPVSMQLNGPYCGRATDISSSTSN